MEELSQPNSSTCCCICLDSSGRLLQFDCSDKICVMCWVKIEKIKLCPACKSPVTQVFVATRAGLSELNESQSSNAAAIMPSTPRRGRDHRPYNGRSFGTGMSPDHPPKRKTHITVGMFVDGKEVGKITEVVDVLPDSRGLTILVKFEGLRGVHRVEHTHLHLFEDGRKSARMYFKMLQRTNKSKFKRFKWGKTSSFFHSIMSGWLGPKPPVSLEGSFLVLVRNNKVYRPSLSLVSFLIDWHFCSSCGGCVWSMELTNG